MDRDQERATQRGDELAIEEEGGAGEADPTARGEALLAESDERQEDREGTAREHRSSADTVAPDDGPGG